MSTKKTFLVWPSATFQHGRLAIGDANWMEVIRPWDGPGACRWTYAQGWRPLIPSWFHLRKMQAEIDRVNALPLPSVFSEERANAYSAAINSIPPDVVRLVRPYRSGHLRLLWASRRGGDYFLQLLDDHPVLALLLAERRRWGIRTPLPELVRRKRHYLLGLFGFPTTPCWARLLRRLDANVITIGLLRNLAPSCSDQRVLRAFHNLPQLSRVILEILSDQRLLDWTTTRFREEASKEGTVTMHELRLAKAIITTLANETAVPIGSRDELRERLGFLHPAMELTMDDLFDDRPLRLRGLPAQETGDVIIKPITTSSDLARESFLLDHCARNYTPEALLGYRTFYAVTAPGIRATLSLRHPKNGRVKIMDLRGPHNKLVHEHLWNAVNEWLKTVNMRTRNARINQARAD